ncbi:putative armadillo-like helical protein [Dioscorea sansibarensis]
MSDNYSSTYFEPQRELTGERTKPKLHRRRNLLSSLSASNTREGSKRARTLGFIWATVVLLGGFAITLEKKDFLFITVILLIEGTRIFSRSHELEWQHQATWSITEAGRASFRKLRSRSLSVVCAIKALICPLSILRPKGNARDVERGAVEQDHRTWSSPEVPLLPYAGWIFLSRNISKMLYWLQLFSASACVVLSLMRLVQQDFGDVDSDSKNRKSALNIFYALAFAEAFMFLLEKAYWEWKVSHCRILEEVNQECDLGAKGMISIKRFFYDSYSKCVNGSIFDGLRMDLVTFAEELLASSSRDEQLIGANILVKFATNPEFSDETLRKLGTSMPAMERLLEMLNWKSKEEEELRLSAAVITSKLASKKQNALRVAGIPGAMESISSLLYTGQGVSSKPDEVCRKCIIVDRSNCEFSVFNLYGLLIFKKLASDHDNCGKIGNTRGLLAKIIDFTSTGEWLFGNNSASETQIRAVKRALQVMKMLSNTTGNTGKNLRREIAEIVFTISNIREILQFGEKHSELQKLGIEV